MMHTTFRMPARRLLSTALVSCLMLAAAPNVMAQSANASLRGQVAGAQAGTEVTATNVATGTVRRGTIRADGSYSLMGLDPGTYDVVANGQTLDQLWQRAQPRLVEQFRAGRHLHPIWQ